MQIYLPIAEMTISVPWFLLMGTIVGFLSGVFGVGGGFMMTPLLVLCGVPAPVAVATQANQLVANSVSSVLGHLRRKNVDMKIAWVMLGGGLVGTLVGVGLFKLLRALGQIDLFINFFYVVFMGTVGVLMVIESVQASWRHYHRMPAPTPKKYEWATRLPHKMWFPHSQLSMSIWIPLGIGCLGGILNAILGIGGGFFLLPAMIYIMRMPPMLVPGTSMFQIMITTAITTLLHCLTTQSVDVVLAMLLLTGGVIGAQFGSRAATRLRPEYSRLLLSLMLIIVAGKLAVELVSTPAHIYGVNMVVR